MNNSDVQFEEDLGGGQNFSRNIIDGAENKGMIGWLIKNRIAKNENSAKTVLISIAVVFFLISGFAISTMFEKPKELVELPNGLEVPKELAEIINQAR